MLLRHHVMAECRFAVSCNLCQLRWDVCINIASWKTHRTAQVSLTVGVMPVQFYHGHSMFSRFSEGHPGV